MKNKKCKKKSNMANYLCKNQTAKMKLQARVYNSNENVEVSRPHTAQDCAFMHGSCSSKKSEKFSVIRANDSATRMTSDLVNLINQTKKDVENLRAVKRTSKIGTKSNTKKSNLISPLGDRSKEDAYGLNDQKKSLSSHKSNSTKIKRKFVDGDSNSNRRNKVKTTNANYQPTSGTINLISMISRKGSHKRVGSIETSERSDTKSKQRFLVSKKYSKQMGPTKTSSSKDNMNSCLTKSLKFAANSSTSNSNKNQTNIVDSFTPTSMSTKINIKGSLIARKCYGNMQSLIKKDDQVSKTKEIKKAKAIKAKEINNQTPNDKTSVPLSTNCKSSNIKRRELH